MLRFATSPTADMHIDDLRIAIVNYLVAQQKKEHFLIRMDDLDKAHNIEGKDTEIMQILEKFALNHDTVFHQSEHLSMHQTLAVRLLEEGQAFICTCRETEDKTAAANCSNKRCKHIDKTELTKIKEEKIPFVIRLNKPEHDIVINDLILGERITSAEDIDEMIILGEDATPSKDFASACDDMLSGINCIIKDLSSLTNTTKEEHIKKALGYEEKVSYVHLPPILESDISLKELFAEGFIPDAILNYLLLLGYGHAPQEIFTLPEAINWFKPEEISKTESTFDIEKLRSINREHLRRIDDKVLSTLFGFADADIGKLAKLYLEESSTVSELEAKIRPVFTSKNFDSEWGESMKVIEKLIWELPMIDSFEEFKTAIMEKSGLKGEKLLNPLRLLLTGAASGPELSDIYPLIKPYLLEVAS